MLQRAGCWCETGTYVIDEWVCEKQDEIVVNQSSCRRMICVKEQGIDALLVLRTCVHRESCVPVLEEDIC